MWSAHPKPYSTVPRHIKYHVSDRLSSHDHTLRLQALHCSHRPRSGRLSGATDRAYLHPGSRHAGSWNNCKFCQLRLLRAFDNLHPPKPRRTKLNQIVQQKSGIGTDIWTRTPQQITNILKYLGFQAMLYYGVVSLLKLCLLAFYLRIFPGYWVQRLLKGTMVFVVVYAIAFIVTATQLCHPISFGWKGWDGEHKGYCRGYYQLPWVNAGISIALDLWMLAIPLWMLRGLQLHWKKKLGVSLMFCVGTFSTVISIIRVRSIIHLMTQDNVTWEYYGTAIWSSVEVAVGIICINMPVLRQALVRAFPALGGSTMQSNTNPQTPGQSKRKSWPVLTNITNRSRNERIPSDSTDQVTHGTAQFVDTKDFVSSYSGDNSDKAKLVEMDRLSPRHESAQSRTGWTDL
jgi:hypothetical protein